MPFTLRMNPKGKPILMRPAGIRFTLAGEIGRRVDAVTQQWLLPVPQTNPRILEMFRERDLQPYASQTPWAGEFAGKYLTCATQILRLTGNAELRRSLQWFVGELVALQAEDGYLGPWPQVWRLRRGGPTCREPWDAWGHYHIMLGLLLWHELTSDERALDCTGRIADLLCRRFLHGEERLHDTGAHEMNQAPVHTLAMLHRMTGEKDYLALAHKIVEEFALPPAGDYYRQGLAGVPFHQTPKPRWESLHPIMGLVQLYYITGDVTYRQAFENLWWSMLEGDRHNNGGFTSGEKATGNPYDGGAIETCCTVAWAAMSVEMLQLSGNPIVADELELSLLNSGLGLISPSGRWVTYNTPMEGAREASAHTIVFQARAGSPELNCCSVNGPRLLGLVSEWALLTRESGELCLNWYGPGTMETALPSGQALRLTQQTAYPVDGRIEISLRLDKPENFAMSLRIPHWSQNTSVRLNGRMIENVCPGQYLRLDRAWKSGDRIALDLDFRLHCWVEDQPAAHSVENWQAQWKVFGPIRNTPAAVLTGDHAQTMPDALTIDGARLMPVWADSRDGLLDFRGLFPDWDALGAHPSAYAFTEIETDKDDILPIVFGADWFVCWFVNGVKIFDNHDVGNGGFPAMRSHRVDLPLHKGKNLVVVRITSGQGGWNLSMGKGLPLSEFQKLPAKERIWIASLYRGPLLLAYDAALNGGDAARQPGFDTENLPMEPGETERRWLAPQLLLRTRNRDGRSVLLCDFASAGLSGSRYTTWLPVRFAGTPMASFSRTQPLRSIRLSEHEGPR